MAMNQKKSVVEFEITEHVGVLSENSSSGWLKELNKVSWNGKEAKYDVRSWSPDHSSCSKGITFTDEEMVIMGELIPTLSL